MFELVTFHIGGSKACFTVYIESDSDLEELELFTLHLYSSDIQVYIPEDVTYAYVIILDGKFQASPMLLCIIATV